MKKHALIIPLLVYGVWCTSALIGMSYARKGPSQDKQLKKRAKLQATRADYYPPQTIRGQIELLQEKRDQKIQDLQALQSQLPYSNTPSIIALKNQIRRLNDELKQLGQPCLYVCP